MGPSRPAPTRDETRRCDWQRLTAGYRGPVMTGPYQGHGPGVAGHLFGAPNWTRSRARTRMATVQLLKYLEVLAVLALVFGVSEAITVFRARAMRALAVRRGLRYVGPPSIAGWGFRKITPLVPIPFSLVRWPNIRVVFNAIEGEQDGVPVLIFDCVIGRGVGHRAYFYRTLFACKTEHNFYETDTSPGHLIQSRGWIAERVVQSNGWSIVYQPLRLMVIPLRVGSMSIREIEDHLNELRAGSTRASDRTARRS
jgi:hypothetical protein